MRWILGTALLASFSLSTPAWSQDCAATIEGNDAIQFNLAEMTVPSGCDAFTVTLKHTGSLAALAALWLKGDAVGALARGEDDRPVISRWHAPSLSARHVFDDPEGGARVEFRATIKHGSFVLPFIGGFFVRKRLRQQLLTTAENLEIEASR